MKILNGETFIAMVMNGYRNLKGHHGEINDLNVFPVPDGDTGTNMSATLTGGTKAMEKADKGSIGDVAKKLAEGMLLGARGNSGVILSQFFAGISDALEGLKTANVTQFAAALRSGTQKAYEAVVHPVEGTILTVAREGSSYVMSHLTKIKDFETLFEVLLKQMKLALDKTPELLPVLKEAGVIDSGGAGLVTIIEGMGKEIIGEEIADSVFNGPANAVATDEKVPFTEDSVLEFGYCTEFILQLLKCKGDPKDFKLKELISFLGTIGDSIVAIQQGTIVKIHVHTKEPWKAIQYVQKYGEFVTFKMENMSIQHQEVLLKGVQEEHKVQPHKKVAIVSVSPSEEITKLFKSMGVSGIVSGGQTMNPSAEDFIAVFDEVNADEILVFPNNGNIILTAEQAGKLYSKSKIHVLKSKSIVQAYSGLAMTDLDNMSVQENIDVINDSMAGLIAAEISPANRDTSNNGLAIHEGDYIGITGGAVVSVDATPLGAADKLIAKVEDLEDRSLLTVFYGEDATPELRKEFAKLIEEKYSHLELIPIEGNQRIYPLILAIE
ncbi:MAG: DAK2 domain-containing protein [Bacilli bacterium]|nr:DAK2 domain-containing protein [Bacilli bacterium]